MLRFLTAGESHGPSLVAIVEGMPSNLPLAPEDINGELSRRQQGYGRGGRMKIEKDEIVIVSGVRHGKTLGSPIALLLHNRDWENWKATMDPAVEGKAGDTRPPVTRPRPGHADLVGALKYDHRDVRNVLERASARETAARVAVGAVCKKLLREFGIEVFSHVVEIGDVVAHVGGFSYDEIRERAEVSPVRCADPEASLRMMKRIDEAREKGTSLGGVFEVVVLNPPVGLGSYVQWDQRLDGRLAHAVMSINAIKGVEIGLGFQAARRFGFEVHDEIFYQAPGPGEAHDQTQDPTHRTSNIEHRIGFYRKTNYAGGLEGGMTNGEPIVLRAAMKPLSTQYTPLSSVDLLTKEPFQASVERSDVCAVPAAGVVGEAMVAITLASAFLEKFGGDSLEEVRRNYKAYQDYLRNF